MANHKYLSDTRTYSANLRAEDGRISDNHRNAFLEYLLALVSLFGATLLFAMLLSPSAVAQAGSGRIAGSVKDVTGVIVPNSQVILVNPSTEVQ